MKKEVLALQPGDVIRTNPQEGFWGCAVVLDRFTLSPPYKSDACHIAITDVVRQTEFVLEDINPSELEVLQFEQHYSPTRDSLYVKTQICIAKHAIVGRAFVELIGSIDPSDVYTGPLSNDIGLKPGEFPLYDSISESLGNEAIITWRRKFDSVAWEALVAKSDAEYFQREEERLRKNREARKLRAQKRS